MDKNTQIGLALHGGAGKYNESDQVEQIAPIIGDGMHGMISLLMDNVDKRLSVPRKIKIGRSAKKIQSDMDKQLMPLLTDVQQQTYEANKEARKG